MTAERPGIMGRPMVLAKDVPFGSDGLGRSAVVCLVMSGELAFSLIRIET